MFSSIGIAQGKVVTETFTTNVNWTALASSIDVASGYGSKGTNATSSQSYIYETQTIYQTRRSNGAQEVAAQSRYLIAFNNNSAYCNPATSTPNDPTYSSNQVCYAYDGFFTSAGNPATAGTSATAFGKTFPGSTGNVAQTPTVFNNVAVTVGTVYPIVVPTGGSVSITYLKP